MPGRRLGWRNRGWLSGERGAAAVIVGLGVTALIGFAAVSIDVGRLYVARFQSQNAADAAALGGAQLLPEEPAGATSSALAILVQNGVDPATALVTVEGEGDRLRVEINGEVTLAFAQVLGTATGAVEVRAVARIGAVGGVRGAAPVGMEAAEFVPGQLYNLKLYPGGPEPPDQGNFHALALGGHGADTYRDTLSYGYDDLLTMGQVVETETGNMAGPTADGIAARLAADPEASYEDFDRDSPRLIIVPLVDTFDVAGRGEVTVVGFAAFFLEEIDIDGDGNAQMGGRFVQMVTDGSEIRDLDEAPPCSLRGVDLVL